MKKVARVWCSLGLTLVLLLTAILVPAGAGSPSQTASAQAMSQPVAQPPAAGILTPCSDLFISEYVEGSSNNKALEIYNPTAGAISLNDYDIILYSNGSTSGTTFTLSTSGSIASGDVWLFCQSSASFAASCDQTTGAGLWNGDDAIVLRHNGSTIDSIGQVGYDPGSQWGSGLVSTENNTIRRKPAIQDGDEDASDVFTDELVAEWDGYNEDTFDGLGSHTMNACGGDSAPTVSSTNPDDGATGVAVDANIIINFSEAVNTDEGWYTINCSSSGSHTAVVSGSGDTRTLDPSSDFTLGETCSVHLEADYITDTDGIAPANMAADYAWSFATVAPPSSLIINEVDADQTGTDAAEFIELYDGGVGNTSLDGKVVVLFNGNGDVSYGAYDLDGYTTDIDGYFVLGNSGVAGVDLVIADNFVQNGADAVALYTGETTDFPNGTAVTTNNLIDALVYDTGDADDTGLLPLLNAGQPQVDEAAVDSTVHSNQRCPNGAGGARNTDTYLQASPTAGASNNCPVDPPPSVVTTTPGTGATGVAVHADVAIAFSEAVNTAAGWYTINCVSSGLHTASVSGGPSTWVLNPDTDFTLGEACTVVIAATQVTDLAGQNMAEDYTWSFTVAAADAAPGVASTTPAPGATGVLPSANLTVNFDENVDVAGAWYNILCTASNLHTAVVTGGPLSWLLNPDSDFEPYESCTVTLYAAGITDQDSADPPDNMAADYFWTFTVGAAAPQPCGGAYTAIYAIQGSGATSPQVGSSVTTQGIVVGDLQDTTELSGFWLQDPWTDDNAATSDGIFVASTTAVNVGEHVRLTGSVVEYGTAPATQTRLTDISDLQICGSGYSVSPTPVTLPIPEGDTLYLEKYEGMLITWPQTLHITGNYNLGRYGEVDLSSGDRLWQPTNVALPGTDAVALQAANDRNRIILDDDNLVQNADPIDHPSPGLTAANTLRCGDTVTDLTGCLSQGTSGYSGTDNYRLHPTVTPSFVHVNLRTAAAPISGGSITVASFNVLNYFNGPTFPTSRGAESAAEFTRQRDKIIPAIVGLHADVVGLMEIENDSGSSQALRDLVDGLNALEGTGTYNLIDTGVLGTDEIRVALIYRAGRVAPVGSHMVDTDPINSRPTLAQTFEQTVTGERFTVVVNHFKSKGCSGATGQDADQGDGQSCYNARRVAQAQRLHTWLETTVIPTANDPDVIIIGDLNSYALEDPITTLTGQGYTNLISQFDGPYTYSYVYKGQSGYLDHALASASIVAQVSDVDHWHINPDEPLVLDYNVNYKSAGQQVSLYNADPYYSSDHDPVLVGLYPFDFSDLDNRYGTAWHSASTLRLGSGWSADPTFALDSDNATDDGMTMDLGTGWMEGETVRIYAEVTGGSGYLAGWFDWNANGVFDAGEKSVAQNVSAGSNTIDFTIPTGAGYTVPGQALFVRFRLYSSEPGILGTETPTGGATGGEVEDSNWDPSAPTAVELTHLTASPEPYGVRLDWATVNETDIAGFNLYRAASATEEYVKLNSTLILPQYPGQPFGAAYEWLDNTAGPRAAGAYYKLEIVDARGASTWYGPVVAAGPRVLIYLPLANK